MADDPFRTSRFGLPSSVRSTDGDQVTVIHDVDADARTLPGTLVELTASTVRVRFDEGVELPEEHDLFVVVVHRATSLFLLTELIGGESADEQVVRFARVAKSA